MSEWENKQIKIMWMRTTIGIVIVFQINTVYCIRACLLLTSYLSQNDLASFTPVFSVILLWLNSQKMHLNGIDYPKTLICSLFTQPQVVLVFFSVENKDISVVAISKTQIQKSMAKCFQYSSKYYLQCSKRFRKKEIKTALCSLLKHTTYVFAIFLFSNKSNRNFRVTSLTWRHRTLCHYS